MAVVRPNKSQIQMAFDAFDSDKGGSISPLEFYQMLIKCGLKITEEQAGLLIKHFSGGKDTLNAKQFEEILNKVYDILSKSKSNSSGVTPKNASKKPETSLKESTPKARPAEPGQKPTETAINDTNRPPNTTAAPVEAKGDKGI